MEYYVNGERTTRTIYDDDTYDITEWLPRTDVIEQHLHELIDL